MRVEVRLIQTSFTLVLLLQTTAVTGQRVYSSVRGGSDVTLTCENLIQNQHECDSTDWTYVLPPYSLEVVKHGQIQITLLNRLSVTANCSLVIKGVLAGDAGLYRCRQYKYGGTIKDTLIYLSVVSIKKEEDGERMRLSCSVSTYGSCERRVKWLYGDKVMDESDEDFLWSQSDGCFTSVTFKKPKNAELFKCAVEDGATDVLLLPFSPGSSVEFKAKVGDTTTATTNSSTTTSGQDWWWFIVAAAVLAGILVVIVVLIIRWKKKKKGNRTQKNGHVVHPEDGVYYASVSYIKNPKPNTRVRGKGDEEDTVTYSVVKASPSSAAASTDPSDVYASVET